MITDKDIISYNMVLRAYLAGIIKITDKCKHCYGELVCEIGDGWFYFGGDFLFDSADEYRKNTSDSLAAKEIYNTLEGFRNEVDFEDEYLYYSYYINERLKTGG